MNCPDCGVENSVDNRFVARVARPRFERSADQLKRSLALYGPDEQADMANRFGLDIAALSTSYGGRSQ